MAENPYVSKVILNGKSLIDLTQDTVDAAHLATGYTAHSASGDAIVGTMEPGITPSGTINITENGTVDVTNYAQANVNVSGGGKNIQYVVEWKSYQGQIYQDTHLEMTCAKSGTYNAKILGRLGSSSNYAYFKIAINRAIYTDAVRHGGNSSILVEINNIVLAAGDHVVLQTKANGVTQVNYIGALILEEA